MFVTNWISTTKIQKISEITNFFRHYFLSRTEVTIYIGDETERYEVTEITKNRLCLRDLNEGDYGDTMTMTRQ